MANSRRKFEQEVQALNQASPRQYRVRWIKDEAGNDYPVVEYLDGVSGSWVQDTSHNFQNAYQALAEMYDRVRGAPGTFNEWLERNPQYGEYQDLSELVDVAAQIQERFESGDLNAEASEAAAINLGFGSAQEMADFLAQQRDCLLYTSPSPRDRTRSRMPSSA